MQSLTLKSLVKLNAILLTLSHSFNVSICEENATTNGKVDAILQDINLYKNLFKVKRKDHLAVVQKLLLVEDVAKLASFVDVTLSKIIETLSKSIIHLEMNGYNAESSFPKDQSTKEELSKVLENTAFFTDLIVRFPTPSHIFYKRNKKSWKKVMTQAISICENSGVFDGDYETLLHNLKQELGIGPKDESYKNPFDKQNEPENELTSEERHELYEAAKRKRKLLNKKTKRHGPKMSSHVDL